MLKIYYYPKCDSCRKALKWLDAQSIHYTKIDISEKPPTRQELKKMLAYCDGELRRLFNTSGQLYRELKIKNKLPSLSTSEATDLLASNGMLVKRPFLLLKDTGLVGFREDEWRTALS